MFTRKYILPRLKMTRSETYIFIYRCLFDHHVRVQTHKIQENKRVACKKQHTWTEINFNKYYIFLARRSRVWSKPTKNWILTPKLAVCLFHAASFSS